MSLRTRLNLLITLLFVFCMLGAGAYVINNARDGVNTRIETTAYLAMQLVEAAIISGDTGARDELRLLVQLAGLQITEHLKIAISHEENLPANEIITDYALSSPSAPVWFVRLVEPETVRFQRVISQPGLPHAEIVVWSDPADEITNAWRETRDALFFLFTFVLAINMLVYFMLGKELAPLDDIQEGLEGIERGDYNHRLPDYDLPELQKITERFNHMADVLKRSRERNRDLAQRTLSIQEAERRSLARELHDELGQTVSAIKAMAMSVMERMPGGSPAVYESAGAIVNYADRMYDVTKDMMHRLRPPILDELGLVPALQEMIDTWNERHEDIFCYFNFDLGMHGISGETAINLYRIVQESLTNVARHSQASAVHITVQENKNELILSVADNGIGFYPDDIHARGIGLAGIQERVEAMNGSFSLNAVVGNGVTLSVVVPLNTDT